MTEDNRIREPLDPAAAAFSAFRVLSGNRGRAYSVAESTGGWPHLSRFITQCQAVGFLVADGGYATLDVLDADDDIVQEYRVRDARAFRWIKRKLHLTVASTDGATSECAIPEPTEGQNP